MRRKSKEKIEFELATIGYMPERFITAYFELTRLGLQIDPRVQGEYNESAKAKRPHQSHSGGLKDEKALRFKAWVDRQLRAIGRDMQAYLNAKEGIGPSPIGISDKLKRKIAKDLEQGTELKCSNVDCRKYISWQWIHCAWCGHRITSTENNKKDGKKNMAEPGANTLELES